MLRLSIKKFNNFGSALPVSQSLLCSYITYLAKSGLVYSSVKTYLSAVRHLQISHGLTAPDLAAMPKLSFMEGGIRRANFTEQQKSRLLITLIILTQLRALWSRNATSFDYIMLCGNFWLFQNNSLFDMVL